MRAACSAPATTATDSDATSDGTKKAQVLVLAVVRAVNPRLGDGFITYLG